MYVLYAGDKYYPKGGWDDMRGTYSSLKIAKIAAEKGPWDWWHIVHKNEIVAEDERSRKARQYDEWAEKEA